MNRPVRTIPPLIWSIGQQVGRQAIGFVGFLVIARYVQASDLGLLGIAMLWVGFLNVFTDLGFSAALIQRATITPAHVSSVFYLNAAAGVAMAIVGAGLAGLVADLLGSPASAPVMRWLSLGFIVTALSTVQNALAQRDMRFSDLALRDTVAMTVGAGVGIYAARQGWGVFALVVQSLTSASLGAFLLWGISPYRFALSQCTREALGELWSFGSHVTAFGIFKYLVRNVDALLIGTMLGPGPLGVYLFAQQLVLQPVAGLESGVGAFVFSRAAGMQEDRPRLGRFFVSAFNLLNCVLVAWALIVTIAAPPVLRLYFGTRWDASFALIWVFAIVVVARAPITPTGNMAKAVGRPQWLLVWSIGFTVFSSAFLLVGVRWNVTGAALAVAAAHVLALPYIVWSLRRLIGLSPGLWIRPAAWVYASASVLLLIFRLLPQDRPFVSTTLCVGLVLPALFAALWLDRPGMLLMKERA